MSAFSAKIRAKIRAKFKLTTKNSKIQNPKWKRYHKLQKRWQKLPNDGECYQKLQKDGKSFQKLPKKNAKSCEKFQKVAKHLTFGDICH